MRGDRCSVRLPRRMVPCWVNDPMGLEIPFRMASTPAMNVVATAPIPGVRMPSLPVAGRMSIGLPVDFVRDIAAPFNGELGLLQPRMHREMQRRCRPDL